ncbi:MAG: HNH endonuclease [Alphaproteobacteria bacterium]|nr:MAG: HNH endonuclease [Alphaproteobacteria bacterium]
MAGNMCQKCGCPLTGSFHADHVKPFSKGGWTVTKNGQALCAPCNLEKGDRYE